MNLWHFFFLTTSQVPRNLSKRSVLQVYYQIKLKLQYERTWPPIKFMLNTNNSLAQLLSAANCSCVCSRAASRLKRQLRATGESWCYTICTAAMDQGRLGLVGLAYLYISPMVQFNYISQVYCISTLISIYQKYTSKGTNGSIRKGKRRENTISGTWSRLWH